CSSMPLLSSHFSFLMHRRPPTSPLFPYTTLFRSLECPGEAGPVRGAETLLALAVQDVDAFVIRGELVGDLAGAVRGVVVYHEDLDLRLGREDAAGDELDVLRLVVRRNDHESAHRFLLPLRTPAAHPARVSTVATMIAGVRALTPHDTPSARGTSAIIVADSLSGARSTTSPWASMIPLTPFV